MVFLPGWWTPVSQLSILNLTYSCKTTSYSWLKSYCCNQRISKCATLILKLTSLCFQFKLLLPVHVKLLLGERSCCLACKKVYWWRNLLATKARRFSIQHCVPLCDQIHDSDGQHHLPNDSRIPILFTWDWCLSVCDWGLTRLARLGGDLTRQQPKCQLWHFKMLVNVTMAMSNLLEFHSSEAEHIIPLKNGTDSTKKMERFPVVQWVKLMELNIVSAICFLLWGKLLN